MGFMINPIMGLWLIWLVKDVFDKGILQIIFETYKSALKDINMNKEYHKSNVIQWEIHANE